MIRSLLIFSFFLPGFIVHAQFNRHAMDSINNLSYADYKIMLKQLHIDSTRRGPSGNPKALDAANTDEAKATPYSSLPDPLILKNGKTVTNSETWWKLRRPEIVEDFDREIYGRVPANLPRVKWELISTSNDTIDGIPAISRQLTGHVDNHNYPSISVDIQLSLTTPAHSQGPVPVIMEFGFKFPPGFRFPDPPAGLPKDPNWKKLLLEEGWGYAIIIPTSFQADNGAGLT